MKKSALVLIMVIIFVFSLAITVTTAKAESDVTPPQLISFDFSKSSYVSGEDVMVTLTASDESGLDPTFSRIYLKNKDAADTRKIDMEGGTEITTPEEDAKGIYKVQYKLSVNDNFLTGQYYISEIQVTDICSNMKWYNKETGDIEEKLIDVTNTSGRSDFKGPVVQSLNIDRTSISVGESVSFTLKAIDPSGLGSAGISLEDPDGKQMGNIVQLNPVPGQPDTMQGSFTAACTTKPGVYTVYFIFVRDSLGNGSGYDETGAVFYPKMPDEWKKSITVVNPGYYTNEPTVTNISLSKTNAKPGDKVKITADIKDNGSYIEDYVYLYIYSDNRNALGYEVDLNKNSTGKYTCNWTVPANFQQGSCALKIVIWKVGGIAVEFYGGCNGYTFPTINISSVFSGLDNRSIVVGSGPFDPLAGVTVSNETEGDMTSKITVFGSVDTNKTGLYLLRYKIPSIQKSIYTGKNLYYYESRWIGITQVMPDAGNPSAPLSLTSSSLQIGAESSDVTVQRNGQGVSFSNAYTTPGVYSVSENTANTVQAVQTSEEYVNQSLESFKLQNAQSNELLESAVYGSGGTAKAVLDNSGPAINATWQNTGLPVVVSVSASDTCGITELKYIAGECGPEQARGGTAFTNTISVGAYGKYTIYSRDLLGNETVKVIDVADPTYNASGLPSSYLANITCSAGSLSRAFSKTVYSYKILLGENEGGVTLTPVRDFVGALITINGRPGPSYTVSLANGKSTKITVKVAYAKKSKTYTFTVTRAKSTNNALSSLAATAGAWSQPFDPNVMNYSLSLDENTKSTAIKAVSAEGKLAGVSPASSKVTLNNGQTKKIKITVKAQSGAKRTYTITVTRAASTNTDLKPLRAPGLSPRFNVGVTNYTVTLPANKSSITLSAGAAGYKAKVTIDGAKRSSKTVKLANGQSVTVRIVVTSQAGNTKEYLITVTRQ